MKLAMVLENSIEWLSPRDVRNFLASVNKRDEYNKKVLWHKHIPPVLIFRNPTKNHLEIINYTNDVEMMEYFRKIVVGKEIYNSQGKSRIKRASLKTENFEIPKPLAPYFAVYRTRTPIIIASNNKEIEKIRKIENDTRALREFLKNFILNSIFHQTKHYLGIDLPEKYKKQILIDIADIKYFYVPYPKKEISLNFPSVKCRVISNYLLPRFVGYRIGYGFGELVTEA